ncbi:hypothetical protein Tsac_2860 [Thermoanaerobacterium phage THSA-485A]|uniref:hypothetical protein n=1 Tax=Thermoanaerobacterium phage THSA-485A TaxID=1126885 RepID=UPI000263F845|nr:hypothetical protein Tsac_2860 [Thermoanaerobacterium phage THSA-485A]AFK87713.1 hypothetical protein Tsac_2860 [Thermoanaerobacterium phage THSA-485A]
MAVNVDKIESTLYIPFRKVEDMPDGSVTVYGLCSGPDTDLDGQKMDMEWLKRAMPEWMLFGNIREMHQPKAVGKAQEYQFTDEGPYLSAKIIDPAAVKKIKEGIYNGYSIGVKNPVIVPDPEAPKGKIVDGQIIEVSVVDYPAYPKAKFSLVKSVKGGWQDMQTGAILTKDASYEDIITSLIEAVSPSGYQLVEVYDGYCIVADDRDGLWKIPYEVNDDEEIELGTPQKVDIDYVPKNVLPDMQKAVWSTAYVNDLPDSSFAYIEPGGKKDEEGKTVPRSLRHLPYKDKDGKPDPAHVRNALARLDQTKISDAAKAEARKKLEAAAKELGIGDYGEKKEVKKVSRAKAEKNTKINKAANPKNPLIKDEVLDANQMGSILQALQSLLPAVQQVLNNEQNEQAEGQDEGNDVEDLQQTMADLTDAINRLVDAYQHETDNEDIDDAAKADTEKDLTVASGLSNYNLDGKKVKKTAKADVRKVGRKMAQDRLNKLTDITSKFESAVNEIKELLKELGDTSFEGGDSDLGDDEGGGGSVKETEHGTPKDKGEEMGAMMKFAEAINNMVKAELVKAGIVKPEDKSNEVQEIKNTIAELQKRLQKIENEPAPTQIATMAIDKTHALNPDKKKNYEDTISKLAQQVASLDESEREKLSQEIIKSIIGGR